MEISTLQIIFIWLHSGTRVALGNKWANFWFRKEKTFEWMKLCVNMMTWDHCSEQAYTDCSHTQRHKNQNQKPKLINIVARKMVWNGKSAFLLLVNKVIYALYFIGAPQMASIWIMMYIALWQFCSWNVKRVNICALLCVFNLIPYDVCTAYNV